MNRVYLDNAATTAIDPAVLDAMLPFFKDHFGNPSSIHSHGRTVRSAIEKSRKKVADLLNVSPAEIFFTGTGTEADNMALRSSVETLGIKRIITSRIEHHAILHTCELLEGRGTEIIYLQIDERGNIDYDELEQLLKIKIPTLVSLMHANNEIGNLLDLQKAANICKEFGATFHSDTVQAMGHYVHDLQITNLNFAVGSAHKFHGPKGSGLIYLNNETKITPLIHGGGQERNMRSGTENVYGIVGLAKALEIAYENMSDHQTHIQGLKNRMIEKLNSSIDGISFNGNAEDPEKCLYTVLNVSLPPTDDNEMLLFNLDINGISCSGGSACVSGSNVGSHVLAALNVDPSRGPIRFSFSKYNTEADIDYAVEKLTELYWDG
ncbi:MAG: cysteine desulfurase [Cytophagales bacterium]|nr:cysteine desulfurase [Cytophagales bacterium]